MTDILNCPCCDGKAVFVNTVKVAKKLIRIGYIACRKCGVRTGVSTYGRVTKTWNRRDVVYALKAKGMGDFGAEGFLNENDMHNRIVKDGAL